VTNEIWGQIILQMSKIELTDMKAKIRAIDMGPR